MSNYFGLFLLVSVVVFMGVRSYLAHRSITRRNEDRKKHRQELIDEINRDFNQKPPRTATVTSLDSRRTKSPQQSSDPTFNGGTHMLNANIISDVYRLPDPINEPIPSNNHDTSCTSSYDSYDSGCDTSSTSFD